MLLLMAGYLVAFAVFTGLGRLVRRGWAAERDTVVLDFWLGFGAALAFTQLWQVFAPIGMAARIAVVAGSLAGWLRPRPARPQLDLRTSVFVLTGLGLAFVVARYATGDVGNGDSGVYHLPVTAFALHDRLLTGLASLNPMLGLQSSFHVLLALFVTGPFETTVHHLGEGIVVFAAFVQVLVCVGALGRAPTTAMFGVLLAPLFVAQFLSHDLVSASADLPVAIVTAITALALCECLESQSAPESTLSVVALGLTCITLKLSGAATEGAFVLVALAAWWRGGGLAARRVLAWTVGLALAAPGVWAVRSVLLSGYPLYPSTFAGLPVSWRLPEDDALRVHNFVIAWGRMSGGPPKPLLHTWGWVAPWLEHTLLLNRPVLLPLGLAAVLAPFALRRRGGAHDRLLWLLPPVFAGLLVWFLTSPDVRFASALLWLPAVVLATSLLRTATHGARLGVALLAGAVALEPLPEAPLPPAALLTLAPLPRPVIDEVVSRSGLVLRRPAGGQCWLEAPCTPWPSAGLVATPTGYALQPGTRVDFDDERGRIKFPDYR